MEIRGVKILFLLSLMFLNSGILFGQEKISPYMQVKYLKDTDNKRALQTTLTFSKNRMELPLPGMKISFLTGTDKKKVLETGVTNDKGIAEIPIGSIDAIPFEKDGSWVFTSEFAGNDTIEAASSEITITEVLLGMTLTVIDTIKTITLNAKKVIHGVESPAGGEKVIVYVPRMFSLLPLGEVTLDESGAGSLEFPTDLPGDKDGTVMVIAKFEDNPAFGNVEKRESLRWGLPSEYSVPSTHRALWTKGAPKWMIYTLSVLLTGVWAHYMYAIISLIMIKIESKKEAKADLKN